MMSQNNVGAVQKYMDTFGGVCQLTQHTIHFFYDLLDLQRDSGLTGDILEIGVFHGATASLLATSLRKDEKLFLIDPYQDTTSTQKTICGFSSIASRQLVSISLDSLFVAKRHHSVLGDRSPSFRFVHIDGEHSYDAVYSDIGLALKYLKRDGVIVIDDIFNINSACCTHAMFDCIRDYPNLHLVAIAFNKAYLTESRSINTYRKFFLQLPETLAEKAGLHIRVAFNSWAHERSYVSLSKVNAGDLKYQVVNSRFATLTEAIEALDLNI